MLDPTWGLLVWTLGFAVVLAIGAMLVRAVLRVARGPRIPAHDANIASLQLRVDLLESDLHAADLELAHLKERTEFAERLAEGRDGPDTRTN